ncbi:MAG: GTPase [Candidatus Odinarchaeia archaeon]
MLKQNIHDHIIFKIKLSELRNLAEALGLEVVKTIVQTRIKPTSKYMIGAGKVNEIKNEINTNNINIVIFYNELTSKQKFNLSRVLKIPVIDRYDLTLEIFEKTASDKLSKIQIEAARLKKLFPYLKLEASVRYLREHPFFRSMGEYAFHNKVKSLRKRLTKLEAAITRLIIKKTQNIIKIKERGTTVCISGYYNSGKTTLFNKLTDENKLVSNQPFSTLSSKYKKAKNALKDILFVDTIGFVFDLNPGLIKSFQLSLLDIQAADVVLFLISAEQPLKHIIVKLKDGIKFLKSLEINFERILIVVNKIDLVSANKLKTILELVNNFTLPVVPISAKFETNIDQLLLKIKDKLRILNLNKNKPLTLSLLQQAYNGV